VIELAGLGPAPFAAMMLADMGAEVLRIDRVRPSPQDLPMDPRLDPVRRGRRSVAFDLKHPEGPAMVLRLVERADVILEGFRPGVAERLGIGPDACLARNPRLIYGRVTGWGQEGPLAGAAGHDINYIALAGALDPIGREGQPPTPPLNLVADYGGGGMLVAFGVVCALYEARKSGAGQVIDAAMIDGAALLMSVFHGFRAMGLWADERGVNLLDSGAPFYDVYSTADQKYVAVGAIEPEFLSQLLELLGLDGQIPDRMDRESWPAMKRRLAVMFASRTRDEWCRLLEGTDACFAPVLSMSEAPLHPHNLARGTFIELGGVTQPAPAPRFSRTQPDLPSAPAMPGADTREALRDWGFASGELDRLTAVGALG
jgi:alpha-methylacyl-CoA racemase